MSSRSYDDYDRFDEPRWVRFVRAAPIGLAVLVILVLLWKSYYTVDAYEQAVVLRRGAYHATQGPGLHFMIPFIDKAVIVDTSEKSMRLPLDLSNEAGPDNKRPPVRASSEESLILTGDLYAGVVEWNIVWRVVEPKDYLFSIDAEDVEPTITAVARSAMHRAVGDYSADEILTTKREEIGLRALEEMRQTLDSYQSGIGIVALQLQRVTPPRDVKPSFDKVNESIQQRDELINQAKRERNELIPAAEGKKIALVEQARGYADRRKAEAEGEISALLARYRAYREAPDVTRRRLYLEAMEEVLQQSGSKTVLDGELKSLLPLLNLGDSPTNPSSSR